MITLLKSPRPLLSATTPFSLGFGDYGVDFLLIFVISIFGAVSFYTLGLVQKIGSGLDRTAPGLVFAFIAGHQDVSSIIFSFSRPFVFFVFFFIATRFKTLSVVNNKALKKDF